MKNYMKEEKEAKKRSPAIDENEKRVLNWKVKNGKSSALNLKWMSVYRKTYL